MNDDNWLPIESAPEKTPLIVGWHDMDDVDNPDRHCFDYKEDGVWWKHEEMYEDFLSAAPPGSRGPKETPPYTHWLAIPPLPAPPKPKDQA